MYRYSSSINLKKSQLDQSEDLELENAQKVQGISHMRRSADNGNFKAYQFLIDNKLMLNQAQGPQAYSGRHHEKVAMGYASSSFDEKDLPRMGSVEIN